MKNQDQWALLRQEPDALRRLPSATPEMQAYALRRRGYLLLEIPSWAIDTESVCPGSTAWAKQYLQQKRGKESSTFTQTIRRECSSVVGWESVRRVAFMPPELVPKKLRKALRNMPFAQASEALDKLSNAHWQNEVRHPEIDYPSRPKRMR